jgi:lipopolysaccharide export system permease LptF/LptG-like protein
MVPGRTLHRFAKFVLPAHVCEQIVDAQLADFQHEWASAPSAPARALVLVRGYLAFAVVLVSCAVGMRGITGDERRALRRVFTIGLAGTLVSIAVMAVAFMGTFHTPVHADAARLAEWQRFRVMMFLNIASQLLPDAVAVGLVCGVAIGLQRHASRASRRVILGVALVSCVAVFVLSSWLLPPAFRALSQVIRGQPSALPAAVTLGDTWRGMVAAEHTATLGPGGIRSAEVGYHLRWSWPFAIVALGLFALSLVHQRRTVRIVLGIAASAAYLYLMRELPFKLVWESRLSPIVVAWLPNLVFVGLSLIVMAMGLSFRQEHSTGRTR